MTSQHSPDVKHAFGLHPMLACPIDVDLIPKKAASYVMEPKLDGVRCLIECDAYNDVTMWTRTRHPIHTKIPHLAAWFAEHLPPLTVVDGELGYPANQVNDRGELDIIDFNKTMRVIGSGELEAERKYTQNLDEGYAMVFYAFDLLQYDGKVLTEHMNGHRRFELKTLDIRCFGPTPNYWYLVDQHDEFDLDFYTDYVERGGEGVILKNLDATYKPGKRPANHWFKLKKNETVDAQIVGFEPGKGKYEGQVGAIIFRTENGDTGRCSGMTDETRSYMSLCPEEHLDKWFELRYFGRVGKDSDNLRHPQFVRFREAKL